MSNKPTLREKKLVTEETERCLNIIDNIFQCTDGENSSEEDLMKDLLYDLKQDIIKEQPYIKYNQHLMERICQ